MLIPSLGRATWHAALPGAAMLAHAGSRLLIPFSRLVPTRRRAEEIETTVLRISVESIDRYV